jgi:hypothetical protein
MGLLRLWLYPVIASVVAAIGAAIGFATLPLHAQSNAQLSSAVGECVSRFEPFERAEALAYVASMCQVRGEDYSLQFDSVQQMERPYACSKLTPADKKIANAALLDVHRSEQAKIGFQQNVPSTLGPACARLRADPDVLTPTDRFYFSLLHKYPNAIPRLE